MANFLLYDNEGFEQNILMTQYLSRFTHQVSSGITCNFIYICIFNFYGHYQKMTFCGAINAMNKGKEEISYPKRGKKRRFTHKIL